MTFGVDLGTKTDAPAVALAVWNAFAATGSLLSRMDADVLCGPVWVGCGFSAGDAEAVNPTTAQGGRASSSTYAGVAVLVRKNTAVAGKKHRGRFFLPWVTGYANINEAGIIVSTDVALLQTALNTFLAALATAGQTMKVLHSDTTAPTAVTSLTVDPLVSSQRRRYGR